MKITRNFIERLLNDLVKASEQGQAKDYLCEDPEFAVCWQTNPEFRDYLYHWAEEFRKQTEGEGFTVTKPSNDFTPSQTPLFITTSALDRASRVQLRINFLRWLLDHGELQ